MLWLSENPSRKRPVLLLEDHLYHIGDVLALLAREAPETLRLLTVLCLDRPGPDTNRSVRSWLKEYSLLQVAAVVDGSISEDFEDGRLIRLDEGIFVRPNDLARAAVSMLRPGGLMLQDIQLETLNFIPRDRWWESIYVATSVRGMFPFRPPVCRFLSNKRGYEATFGVDLLDAGFDPRDVLDKGALEKVLVPILRSFLETSMPFHLVWRDLEMVKDTVVGRDPEARTEVEEALDLVLWCDEQTMALGGRAVRVPARKPRLEFKPGSLEAETWHDLVADYFAGGEGVPVLEVGKRTAPEFAGRAERTNCAARHIHLLRSRLMDGAAIQTVEHAYRIDRRLRAGRGSVAASERKK